MEMEDYVADALANVLEWVGLKMKDAGWIDTATLLREGGGDGEVTVERPARIL